MICNLLGAICNSDLTNVGFSFAGLQRGDTFEEPAYMGLNVSILAAARETAIERSPAAFHVIDGLCPFKAWTGHASIWRNAALQELKDLTEAVRAIRQEPRR